MATLAEKILDEALDLPVEARLSLVEGLLSSLNLPTQETENRLWAEEAERRVAQIENDAVACVSGEEVFERIKEKYRR